MANSASVRAATLALTVFVSTACLGPEAELVFFEGMGSLGADIDPVELGVDAGNSGFADELRRMGADEVDWSPALEYRPLDGERVFAFVETGCAEESAELKVSGGAMSARLIGPDADCAAPYTYLAVFSVDADDVPETVRLE